MSWSLQWHWARLWLVTPWYPGLWLAAARPPDLRLLTLHVNISNCLAFQVSLESYERETGQAWHVTHDNTHSGQTTRHSGQLSVIMTTLERSDIMQRSPQPCQIPLLSGGEHVQQWAGSGARKTRGMWKQKGVHFCSWLISLSVISSIDLSEEGLLSEI